MCLSLCWPGRAGVMVGGAEDGLGKAGAGGGPCRAPPGVEPGLV